MKALRLHDRGTPARFVYEDAPQPAPRAGEVLVRVRAAAVTPTELQWFTTSKLMGGAPRPLPLVLGHEFSGAIAAVGEGVSNLRPGDLVYGMNDWFRDGAQAEFCVASAGEVAGKPSSLDHREAAATPISALTAWQGLIERGHLASGQRVLIHGATGGVGLFAVQLARWRGAEVIATASTAHLELARELGADEVIDYRTQRFDDVVRDCDLVFDTVGGDTLERSWSVLRPGGALVTIAASEEGAKDPRRRDAFFIVEPNHVQLLEITRLIDAGTVRVLIGAELALADGARAYAEKPARGKNVLRVD